MIGLVRSAHVRFKTVGSLTHSYLDDELTWEKSLILVFAFLLVFQLAMPHRIIQAAGSVLPRGFQQGILMNPYVESAEVEALLPPFNEERADKGATYETKWAITVPVTSYSSTPDQTDSTPFLTARSTIVRDGVIAANFLPFGTRVRFPEIFGDKIFIVEDRMNQRYWHRIDIWMPDRQLAKDWGIKYLRAEVVEQVN